MGRVTACPGLKALERDAPFRSCFGARWSSSSRVSTDQFDDDSKGDEDLGGDDAMSAIICESDGKQVSAFQAEPFPTTMSALDSFAERSLCSRVREALRHQPDHSILLDETVHVNVCQDASVVQLCRDLCLIQFQQNLSTPAIDSVMSAPRTFLQSWRARRRVGEDLCFPNSFKDVKNIVGGMSVHREARMASAFVMSSRRSDANSSRTCSIPSLTSNAPIMCGFSVTQGSPSCNSSTRSTRTSGQAWFDCSMPRRFYMPPM